MLSNPNKVSIAIPQQEIDRAVYAPNINEPLAINSLGTITKPVGTPSYYFPVGIFTFDGVTYYDLSGSAGFSSNGGIPEGPDYSGHIRSKPDGTVQYRMGQRGANTTVNAQVRAVMLARPSQNLIDPNNAGKGLAYDSRKNYQKILLQGTSTTNETINHNLGYVPFFRAWREDTEPYIAPTNTRDVYATTNTLVVLAAGDIIHWRIYLDN